MSNFSTFTTKYFFTVEAIQGWKAKKNPPLAIPKGDPNHPDVDAVQAAYQSGWGYSGVMLCYNKQMIGKSRESGPFSAASAYTAKASPITFDPIVIERVKEEVVVTVKPIRMELERIPVTIESTPVIQCVTVGEKRTFLPLAVACRTVATVCRIVRTDNKQAEVVPNNVSEPPNGWPLDNLFSLHFTQSHHIFVTVHRYVDQIKEKLLGKLNVLQGRDLADALYLHYESNPLRVAFLSVCCGSLPVYSEKEKLKGGVTLFTQNKKVPVTEDGKTEVLPIHLVASTTLPDIPYVTKGVPKAHMWPYVRDQARLARGSNHEKASSLSYDYFFGLGLDKQMLQFSAIANDMLSIPSDSVLVVNGIGKKAVQYKQACVIYEVFRAAGHKAEVCYLSFQKQKGLVKAVETVPDKAIMYCGDYIRGHDPVQSDVKKARIASFFSSRALWGEQLAKKITLFEGNLKHSTLFYTDAVIMRDNAGYVLGSMMHEGLALGCTHGKKLTGRFSLLSDQGLEVIKDVTYAKIEWSIQFANFFRNCAAFYGSNYPREAARMPKEKALLWQPFFVSTIGSVMEYAEQELVVSWESAVTRREMSHEDLEKMMVELYGLEPLPRISRGEQEYGEEVTTPEGYTPDEDDQTPPPGVDGRLLDLSDLNLDNLVDH